LQDKEIEKKRENKKKKTETNTIKTSSVMNHLGPNQD